MYYNFLCKDEKDANKMLSVNKQLTYLKRIFTDEDYFAKYISNATTETLNNFFRNGNFVLG